MSRDNRSVIIKNIEQIEAIKTSHQIGLKKVFLSDKETISDITQIAFCKLSAKETVESHIHISMDEHYIFTSGNGIMYVDHSFYECKSGMFILVPAGSSHYLEALTDLEFYTIGVAI